MLTIGVSLLDQMTYVRTGCHVILLRMCTALWLEGEEFPFYNVSSYLTELNPRYQSKKRRPFSRYTSRADKVRREKSFATGRVNIEDQLNEIRDNVINIQGENNLIRRNMEDVKGE